MKKIVLMLLLAAVSVSFGGALQGNKAYETFKAKNCIKEKNCKEQKINAVIEIPFGSNIKYELDKDSGVMVVNRVLYSAVFYPANYGFVPGTLADDGDPADILVLNDYALQVGSVIPCRLIGVLVMEDQNGMDEKLLAVPVTKIDPRYDNIKEFSDLPKATQDRIKNFFETYKLLEPGKWVKVKGFENAKKAQEILDKAIKNYK